MSDRVLQIAACPTPYYHETHRYCPSCPWTEDDGQESAGGDDAADADVRGAENPASRRPVTADPLITEPRSCGHKFVMAATCEECARSLQAKCRHDATAFLGWRSGVPLRECLRCKAVVRP